MSQVGLLKTSNVRFDKLNVAKSGFVKLFLRFLKSDLTKFFSFFKTCKCNFGVGTTHVLVCMFPSK
jgi:hypothetical protein